MRISERDLQRTVLDMCAVYGLRVAHFRPARTDYGWRTPVEADGAGFPDLVIAGPGGVLFRELKSDRGRLSPDQRMWQAVLADAGADVAVWTPAELSDGTIAAALRRLAAVEVTHG